MSQEIVEAVREIEREKGIDAEQLLSALEDALLAAYKKTPGASRHATVELDDAGDYRVFAIELPPDLERRLLDEAREHALDELERIEEERAAPCKFLTCGGATSDAQVCRASRGSRPDRQADGRSRCRRI